MKMSSAHKLDSADSSDFEDESPVNQSVGINSVLFKRLRKLVPLLFPGVFTLPFFLFFVLLLTCFLEQYVIYNVGLISSRYYLVLGAKDWDGFVRTTIYSVLLVVSISGVLCSKKYIASILSISWRQVLSRALHRLYFTGVNYYTITLSSKHKLDNPDMRMTQDVELLCSTLGTMTATIIIAPFKIGYYTYAAYTGTGWLGPTMIIVFFLVSSVINKLVMNPIVPCVVYTEKCEGDLRFKHMQIRAGSESVAFHVSGAVEANKTNVALDEVVRAKQTLFNKQYWLNLCQNLFDYLGSILSYLAIAVPIFGGVYDGVDANVLSSIISKNAFVCIMLISSLSALVGLCTQVVQVAGAAHRVGQLLEALHALHRRWNCANEKASNSYSDLTGGDQCPPEEQPPPYSPRQEEDAVPQPPPEGEVTGPTDTFTTSPHEHKSCDSTSLDSTNLLLSSPSNPPKEGPSPSFSGSALPVGFMLQNVTLSVPGSGKPLVKDLNLSITRGHNLLIMGPSSSGKTSLLRALRGLWPIQEGVLAYQSYRGPKAVMFLPQRPFLTNGTLREQIVYPEHVTQPFSPSKEDDAHPSPDGAVGGGEGVSIRRGGGDTALQMEGEGESDELIKELLGKVQLEFLLDRCKDLDTDPGWVWSDVLSPGEVQRLCFLRVLFHRPHFAILDEVTSALSSHAEETLYSLADAKGVTVISVGHRASLKAFHRTLLTLDGEGGWTTETLQL